VPTSPTPDAPPRRRPWWRRLLKRIAILAGLLLALALGLYLTRAHTLHPMLRRVVAWTVPRVSDFEVELDRISGDWFSGLELEGLRLRNTAAAGPLRELDFDRVAVDLRLIGLLRSEPEALRGLELGTGRVEVDLTVPTSAEAAEPSGAPSFPDWLPLLQVEALTLDLGLGSGDRLRVRDAHVSSTRGSDGAPIYDLSLPAVELEGESPLTTSGELRLTALAAGLRVDRLELHGTPISGDLNLDLARLAKGELGWSFDLAALNGQARGKGQFAAGSVSGELNLDGLRLSHLRDLLDAPWAESLAGELDLQLALFPGDLDANTIDVTLDGRNLAFKGRRLDRVQAEGRVAGGEARVATLSASRGDDRLSARDLYLPFGAGDIEVLLASSSGSLSAEVNDLGHWLHGQTPPDEPLPSHRISLQAEVADGRLTFIDGSLRIADGTLELRGGELELPTPADRGRHLALELEADFDDLAPVGALVGGEAWAGSLKGHLQVEGDLPALEGHAQLLGAQVTVAGFELGAVELVATGRRGHLTIESMGATNPDLNFALSGGYDLAAERLEGVALELEVVRPNRFAELLAPGGRLKLDLQADGPWRTPSGELRIEGLDLTLAGLPLDSLEVSGRARGGALDITRLACGTPFGQVNAALDLNLPLDGGALNARLREFSLEAEHGDLKLEAPAEFVLNGGDLRLGELSLAGSAGAVSVDLTLDGNGLRANARAAELDLTPFLGDLLPAQIAGLELDLEGSYAPGRLELERLAASVNGERLLDVSASLPIDPLGTQLLGPGPLEVTGQVALPRGQALELTVDGQPLALTGTVSGRLDLAGSWRAVTGRLRVQAGDLRLTPEHVAGPTQANPARAELDLTLGEQGIELNALSLELPTRGTLRATGSLERGLDLVALLESQASSFEDAAVELDSHFELEQLAWVAELSDSLRRVGGQAQGTLRVRGSLAAPEVSGTFELEGGDLKLAGAPKLDALHARIGFEQGKLTFEDLGWEMGAAPVNLTGGLDLGAQPPRVDVQIAGTNVLLSRSGTQRVRGDLNLAVAGPLDGLTISGEVGLRHSRILQEIDFLSALQAGGSVKTQRRGVALPSFRSGPLADARFDLVVRTIDPLHLVSNVARGEVRMDMRIGGTGAVLVPEGRVFLDGLKVALSGGTVTFPTGLITFEQGDPYDPRLELNGEARLAGYDVDLRIADRLTAPTIQASASPPLPDDDLLLLILTGQVPAAGQGGEAAARSLGLYVAKDLFSKWTGGTSLDEDPGSFWSRLEISSGQDVSKAGVMTMEVTYRWKEGYPGKQGVVYLIAERDVFEDYNMGVRFVLRRR
jgi:autotransporter translocation and assembly factor TamB